MDLGGDDEEEGGEEGAPAWMATFSDMATLLLTFFILLLSFANMDVVQFREMMGSIREAFGVQHENPGSFQARATTIVHIAEGGSPMNPSVLQHSPIVQQLLRRLREQGLDSVVDVQMNRRGVSLRIRDGVLFQSGSDQLLPGGVPLLDGLADIAADMEQDLAIEGHTDDRPISNSRFPSNWELSAGRATAVLRHLTENNGIDRERMSIAGYADTRPVADNGTPEGRARNRRVEFIFLNEGEDPADSTPVPPLEELEAAGADAEAAAAQPDPEPPSEAQ